ncbi:MAG: MerR family transcriptional regulator [Rhodocyclaceae bacterium]
MIPIGQLARLMGITTRTLRHYDAIGLFAPARVHPDTGYRYYAPAQAAQLERILQLRKLTVPLERIQALQQAGTLDDPATFAAFLRQHRHSLRDEIAQRTRLLDELEAMIHAIDQGPAVLRRPEIIDLPAFDLIGLSVICEDPDAIPRLWDEFVPRRHEICSPTPAISYGLCECIDGEHFRYAAGCAATPDATLPAGMSRFTIAARRYACVTHVGAVAGIAETFRQAWRALEADWHLTPGHGPDLERYDERFRGNAPHSETDLLIPLDTTTAAA